MTAASKKALLKKLIESERDPAVLDLVNNVLQRRTRGVAFQSDMVQRVMRAEEDYKAGRSQTLEEFGKDMEQFIDSLYVKAAKPKKHT
ncbi:MAG: hypothetical protein IPP83_06915 [Flavobacteriales bacterium]|nr:hypothetical protein [Flavobacteriales bacterium]MCC6938966.1 hypothetical protein [Flavobacteriales bacterium]